MPSSRPSRDHCHSRGAFTLIELLTVITIIIILVGLVIGAAGFANTKASRSRAEGEIRALGTIMENYKSDNGAYPRSTNTDALDARTKGNPVDYTSASRDLFALLSGQVDAGGVPVTAPVFSVPTPAAGVRNYWGDLKPNMLGGLSSTSTRVTAINDPYGFSYGYSTAYQADLDKTPPVVPPTHGYNPTFDLWSVANKTTSVADTPGAPDTTARPVWIKNW